MADRSIAEILELARQAHEEYRLHVPRVAWTDGKTQEVGGDLQQAAAGLARAVSLRRVAERQDPTHADPAWAMDASRTGGEHVLTAWYEAYLKRADDPVAAMARDLLTDDPF